MGDGEHAEADLLGGRLDPAGAGPQRVDVEARVELVEQGDLRLEHAQLQRLVLLLLAARQVDVDGPHQQLGVEGEPLGLGRDRRPHQLGVAARGPDGRGQQVLHGHARHLGRVLQRQEQPGVRPLPGRHGQHVGAVERHRPAEHLVAGPAHDHVRQGRLARAVGAHDRVDLARANRQVDPSQDLLAGHPGPQALDLQHVLTHRSPPRSRHPRHGPRTSAPGGWPAGSAPRRSPGRTRCRASSTRACARPR